MNEKCRQCTIDDLEDSVSVLTRFASMTVMTMTFSPLAAEVEKNQKMMRKELAELRVRHGNRKCDHPKPGRKPAA